jgi:hypothetical protein
MCSSGIGPSTRCLHVLQGKARGAASAAGTYALLQVHALHLQALQQAALLTTQ